MADIQEKITQLCLQAQVDTTGEFPMVTVDDAQWHDLARALKEQLHYDVLSAVVGMDWTEALGCVYYLTNTSTHELLHVKVATADRENPRLHSVCDLWPVANFQEREVYDFWTMIPRAIPCVSKTRPTRTTPAAGSRTSRAMSRRSTARCLRTTSMS